MKKNVFIIGLFLLLLSNSSYAQTWIWYPGDFEIWLSNEVQTRRTERDVFIPPFWRVDGHYQLVKFSRTVELAVAEDITVYAEGKYNVTLDGAYVQSDIHHLTIPAGKHEISFLVYNPKRLPSLFIKGKTIISDNSWSVSPQNRKIVLADSWNFNTPEASPSGYHLEVKPQQAVHKEQFPGSWLVDFGKETFGYPVLHHLSGKGQITLYYGESREEALSTDKCETLDRLDFNPSNGEDITLNHSRAFRYINIHFSKDISFSDVSMMYEYLPVTYRGAFSCSDATINKIWETAAYTLHLSCREFFLDGIKRDRWLWSGDAYQSYLMNYYLFFDNDAVKRTTWALRGKEPVETHINTILDYSFYWFMGIYDYYLYSGDKAFLQKIYPRMVSLMEFCLNRRNVNGMVEGLADDWVFLDWAPMSKKGELSAEQLLFCRSLETMSLCSSIMQEEAKAAEYKELASKLQRKIITVFWDAKQNALVHGRENEKINNLVTKYANIFAMMFGYLDNVQTKNVKENVLLNDNIQKITTPYMRFYELAALCSIGEHKYVLDEMRNYWGGMLGLGATSFWEEYNPALKGSDHYAMYGRPFGKSLCHAWGASPIYLLGKYFLGVKPLSPGYKTYLVEPQLGGLEWMEGKVPTPVNEIAVKMTRNKISVKTPSGSTGTLRFKSGSKPTCKEGVIKSSGDKRFEMELLPDREYQVNYSSL
jgi:hypothetical protein